MRNEQTTTLIGDIRLHVPTADFYNAFTPSNRSFHITPAQFDFLRSKGFKHEFVNKVSAVASTKQFLFESNQDLLSFVNRNLPFIQLYK